MISKKIITFGVVGSILLGGTAVGAYRSLAQGDEQSKAIVNEVVLADESKEEPTDGLACELTVEPKKDIVAITNEVDMYNAVLDYFIGVDEALNIDMKYIAVNFNENITDENKENILENLKKYNVDIIESNLEELIEKGLADEYGNLDGILLSISDIKVESENRIMIEGSKYRSGLGSVSNQVILNNVNGTWELEEVSFGPVS